eukprot:1141145-Pelagomonas_calceolata.AAC.2
MLQLSCPCRQVVIGVRGKEDSKMRSMPCSFVLALLCVLFKELMHIGTAEQPNYLVEGQIPLLDSYVTLPFPLDWAGLVAAGP